MKQLFGVVAGLILSPFAGPGKLISDCYQSYRHESAWEFTKNVIGNVIAFPFILVGGLFYYPYRGYCLAEENRSYFGIVKEFFTYKSRFPEQTPNVEPVTTKLKHEVRYEIDSTAIVLSQAVYQKANSNNFNFLGSLPVPILGFIFNFLCEGDPNKRAYLSRAFYSANKKSSETRSKGLFNLFGPSLLQPKKLMEGETSAIEKQKTNTVK